MMKLEYALTRADQQTFNRIAQSNRLLNRNLLIIIVSTLVVLALINGPTQFWSYLGPYQSIVQIGLIFCGLFALRFFVKRRAEARCEQEFKESHLADPVGITFDDQGLTSEQEHQKTIWKWSAFRKVSIEDGNIFLWFGNLQAVMIPARSFQDHQERDDLLRYINERISQK